MKAKTRDRLMTATCLLGVLVSTYALYVEMSVEVDPGYKALCDISEHASCSRVLTSKYAKGFGIVEEDSPLKIPNCIFGIIFYCIMIFLTTFEHLVIVRLQFLLGAVSVGTCFYMAYLLAFVLHDFCVVCISIYFVNGILVFLIYKKLSSLAKKND